MAVNPNSLRAKRPALNKWERAAGEKEMVPDQRGYETEGGHQEL